MRRLAVANGPNIFQMLLVDIAISCDINKLVADMHSTYNISWMTSAKQNMTQVKTIVKLIVFQYEHDDNFKKIVLFYTKSLHLHI